VIGNDDTFTKSVVLRSVSRTSEFFEILGPITGPTVQLDPASMKEEYKLSLANDIAPRVLPAAHLAETILPNDPAIAT